MVDESDSKWVYVKSLAGAKNQPRPVRSKLVYHWIDENNHEPFDSSKFEKGNNFCMYFGGTAVRHAAYAFADSKEELMAKMLKQKGNITLRAATVPPRRALFWLALLCVM
ncbi:Increased recombination centers protein 22 [Frankliniella fusca]|uniref:Increased recombination centers protein 22 n=1 Tax=Frankliniella fusca TaxID=407009 RepID=A0AAE1L7Q1_9NEOP|nr:Increased recombination centers protein 22 [Frankliniella fusca]